MFENDLLTKIESDIRIRPFIRKLYNYDENLYIHSKNVALLTEYIINELGYSERSKWDIVTGALLHDIGKTFLPLDLINKPDYLTGAEFTLIKNHCGYGYELLKDFEPGDVILDIVLHHHENEVGRGYPFYSTFMHTETKIVSLCDKYEAIHSSRPYKQGYTHEETMDIMLYEFEKYTDTEDIKRIMYKFSDIRFNERV